MEFTKILHKNKWIKLKDIDRENIMIHLKDYVYSTPEKKFRLNPETYLNQKGWNNEIINSNKETDRDQGSKNYAKNSSFD